MIRVGETTCPDCDGELRYYDRVKRMVKGRYGAITNVYVRRLLCPVCHRTHRELPYYIFPYKQYDAEIISGVREGLITCMALGFEDYPCEMTMSRWRHAA